MRAATAYNVRRFAVRGALFANVVRRGLRTVQWYSGRTGTETVNPNYERIYRAVAAIPAGQVASYGQVAARAGLPGRARLVGRALRETPDDVVLPWHRVLRADGSIGLARNSHGWYEQGRRLRAEGVVVRNGRVRLADFAWTTDLDQQLWGETRLDAAPEEVDGYKQGHEHDEQ